MSSATIYSKGSVKYRLRRWPMKEKEQKGYGAKLKKKKEILTRCTKYLLDFMFYAGIAVTVTLPWSIRKIGLR